jgi:ubiquinone biosynthesis protein Coq4
MDQLGVDFDQFDRKPEPKSEHEIIDRHVFETHDIWHALTGFGTGPANEIGLQAFTLAQMEGVPSLTLVTLSMFRIFAMGGSDVAPLFDAITAGWRQGREAKSIFGVDWRPHLERPLDELRAEFCIVPVQAEELVEIAETIAA